ncbi:hypothetical protein LXL04_019801 [Taraxacum kok-saghyz]
MNNEQEKRCPLCVEEMDWTDQQLNPWKCGYEVWIFTYGTVSILHYFIYLVLACLITSFDPLAQPMQVCVWCWHHIMDMAEKDVTEGRCPACRTPYDKDRIVGVESNFQRVAANSSIVQIFKLSAN